MQAANRVVYYLYKFKILGLEYSDINFSLKVFNISSNTAFRNNINIKKSLNGFLIQLYSGLIDWKAFKQRTITTLNIKIKLLALSSAAKRLYNKGGFSIGSPSILKKNIHLIAITCRPLSL